MQSRLFSEIKGGSAFLKLGFLKKWGFQKVQYETKLFVKTKVKTVKKWFLKKLSVWLTLIKMAIWEINYQKWQCIYKGVYFILKSTTSYTY